MTFVYQHFQSVSQNLQNRPDPTVFHGRWFWLTAEWQRPRETNIQNKAELQVNRDGNFKYQCRYGPDYLLNSHETSLEYAPASASEVPTHRDFLFRFHSRHHLDCPHPNAPPRRFIPRPDVYQCPDCSVVPGGA